MIKQGDFFGFYEQYKNYSNLDYKRRRGKHQNTSLFCHAVAIPIIQP